MANYNKNDRNKGGYFDQYVNFDQFLMQHNINNWSPLRSPQSGYGFPSSSSDPFKNDSSFHSHAASNPNGAFYFYPQSNVNSGIGTPNHVQNSNLTATASEFIPQSSSSTSNSSSLLATACEFIPKHLLAPDKPLKELSNNETKRTDTAPCDIGKSGRAASNTTDDNTTKTESVVEALSNTHISDGNKTDTNTLNCSGGAIKKVRSQDYRIDSRDRHSNGEFRRKMSFFGLTKISIIVVFF